jgi:8-oxo-dGTP pyrophosphatase MutT (NUDIX family)
MSLRIRHTLSASVFVALRRGLEVCLLRRKGTGWMDGSFSIVAGGLDASETIAAAAIRESQEEVGVRISLDRLDYAHTLHALTAGNDWVGHFFSVRTWSGTPRLCEPDKHSDLIWCSVQNLPDETIPYVRQALLCIERGQTYSEFGWSI